MLGPMGGSNGMLTWSVEATGGFDTAWVTIDGDRLEAEGRAVGQLGRAYWIDYRLETGDRWIHRRMRVESRWQGGGATLDLRRDDGGGWTVNGEPRPDLAEALDCDLMACPLTNTMPIRRHDLHRREGEQAFLMAFIEVPSLRVVANEQRYTHLRALPEGGAIVRYASGSFSSDLRIDGDGFVVEYPQLGRRLAAPA